MSWLLLVASMACADTASDPAVTTKMQLLAEDAQQGKRWLWGWGSSLVVSIAGQFTLAAVTDDDDFRIDRLVGGGTATVGLMTLVFMPPSAVRASRELSACPTEQELDEALLRVAEGERSQRAWIHHVLGAAVNVGAGLYLGLAHDHWASGVVQAVVGTGLSEAMTLTRPRRVADFAVAPTVSSTSGEYGLSLSIRM